MTLQYTRAGRVAHQSLELRLAHPEAGNPKDYKLTAPTLSSPLPVPYELGIYGFGEVHL